MENIPQLAGREMLNERFGWLLANGEREPMRLLAKAAAENGYSDAIDYLYADTSRLREAARLFDVPGALLFGITYKTQTAFYESVEAFREGKEPE